MRRVACIFAVVVLGAAPLLFAGDFAGAQATCPASGGDFLTGGGFIIPTTNGDHANFGVGGSCKEGGDGHGLWGHLEYIDHGVGLKVHWIIITAYLPDPAGDLNARVICGRASTNLYGTADFVVRAADDGQPGKGVDQFDIAVVGSKTYTTFTDGFPHVLMGGNIVLHKPNPAGPFGGQCPLIKMVPVPNLPV